MIFIFTHFGVRWTKCNDILSSFMKPTCVSVMLYFVSFGRTTCTVYSVQCIERRALRNNVRQYNFVHIMRKSNQRAKRNNVQTYQFMFNGEWWREQWIKPNQTKSMIKCGKNILSLYAEYGTYGTLVLQWRTEWWTNGKWQEIYHRKIVNGFVIRWYAFDITNNYATKNYKI